MKDEISTSNEVHIFERWDPLKNDTDEEIVFDNLEIIKYLVKEYNSHKGTNFVTKTSGVSQKSASFQCPCGFERKSSSKGIRKSSSAKVFTGCPAAMRFYRRVDGIFRIKFLELNHNHDLDLSKRRVGKNRPPFKWDQVMDSIVIDCVQANRDVHIILETLQACGIEPLPSLGQILVRMSKMKKHHATKME